ncbi:P2Y purinoceptor 3-like [Periophthalmus magnuspinnatus]|uniref:P2Y purinoceptor 3-like n=1 Tax=Periophthalmus magnuspinnatus TaxID=409849 RepID=UPI00145C0BBD|nr:P2Y purinoceptor 3-like [Periophthalmus magnuspinnatus]
MEDPHICPVKSFYQRILLPVAYSIVFFLGFGLNVRLLWCVFLRNSRRSNMITYLSNLAVADLLYVLSLPPLIISNSMGDLWPFGDFYCKATRFFFFVNLHCSMLFLTCVSAHRFIGVCYPLKAVRTKTRKFAFFTSASLWVLATAEILPTFYFSHTGVINNITVCFEMVSPGQFKMYFPYGLFLVIVGFLIPSMVVVACYCSVLKVLYKGTTINLNGISKTVDRDWRNKSLRTLLLVSLLFLICFLPYHVARTIYMFVRVYQPANCQLLNTVMISYKVWKPVVSLNCCVNPLLYFWGSGCNRARLRACLWRDRRVQPRVCVLDTGIRS